MHAGCLHVADRAVPGSQHLIAARAMRHRGAGAREPLDLAVIEMDAVREPDPFVEPAAILEIIERPAFVELFAERVLVLGLGEMGVHANVQTRRQLRRPPHQRRRHRERRTGRERDLHHRALAGLVITRHNAFTVGEDRVLVLHDAVRRQPAVALRQVHRAARQQHPQPEPLRRRDFDVDGVFDALRKHVMMIGGRGAAGQHQLRHRQSHAEIERLRRQPRPDRIERLQPWKQFAVQRGRHRARQRLVEMMMGVDQARQHHVLGGVEHPRVRRGRACRPAATSSTMRPSLHDDAALGAVGEDGERVLDPQRRIFVVCHDQLAIGGRPTLLAWWIMRATRRISGSSKRGATICMPDRQSVVRQAGRRGRGRQADQRDQIGRRDPVDIVLELAAVDLVREIHLDRIRLHRRGRRRAERRSGRTACGSDGTSPPACARRRRNRAH